MKEVECHTALQYVSDVLGKTLVGCKTQFLEEEPTYHPAEKTTPTLAGATSLHCTP